MFQCDGFLESNNFSDGDVNKSDFQKHENKKTIPNNTTL